MRYRMPPPSREATIKSLQASTWRENVKQFPTPDDSELEIWTYEMMTARGLRYCTMIFGGKRNRPDEETAYKSDEQRRNAILCHIGLCKANAERKAARKVAVKAAPPHTLKVGDLLYCSWGYDQTNVDFYAVTALHGTSMVTIETIGSTTRPHTDDEHYYSNHVKANPEIRTGEFQRKRVRKDNTISLTSYSNAYPYDGEWKYETPFGGGH